MNRKRSGVWLHFSVNSSQEAKCKLCSQVLKIKGGSTTNLQRHLTSKHPFVKFKAKPAQPSAEQQVEEHHSAPSSDDPLAIPGMSASITFTENLTSETMGPSKISSQGGSKQCKITEFSLQAISPSKAKSINTQLLKTIVKEFFPFSLVEGEEMKKLFNMLNPNYNLPSRKTLSYNLLNEQYEILKENIKNKIQFAKAVSITTDSWTSTANKNYLAVTAHYIDELNILSSNLLECFELEDSHTAQNISSHLIRASEEWNVHHKVCAAVTDNAANMVAAIQLCQWKHVPCFAHTLNLIVQAGLSKASGEINKLKSVVQFLKRSPKASNALTTIQAHLELPQLKMKQEVCTRWNSCYEMIRRVIEVKDALKYFLVSYEDIGNLSISRSDWEVFEQLSKILKIYDEATKAVSSEKHVTLSNIIIITNAIRKYLDECYSESLPMVIKDVLTELANEHIKKFNNVEKEELYAESLILDPRFKKYGFMFNHNYLSAHKTLQNKVGRLNVLPSPCLTSTGSSSLETSLLFGDVESKIKAVQTPVNPAAAGIVQLDKYINEASSARHEDPLKWWRDKKQVYPRLFEIVLKRLNIPATSVPSERIFSKAGYTVSQRRSTLTSDKIKKIMFLNCNL